MLSDRLVFGWISLHFVKLTDHVIQGLSHNPSSQAVCEIYNLAVAERQSTKGNNILYIFAPPNAGKTTLCTEGFGAVVPTIKLQPENGWIQNFQPNSAVIVWFDGFTADSQKAGVTTQILEALGDQRRQVMPVRYGQAQPETNGEFTIIASNYPPEEVFNENDWTNVMEARLAVVQGTKDHTFFEATNAIREANGLPPLRPAPTTRRFNVRYT